MKQLLAVILLVVISMALQAQELQDNQIACNYGHAVGCQNLGDFYYEGKDVKQNYLYAAYYYSRACDGGYVGGCSALASMYEKEQGIVNNLTKAATLYAKACDGNDFKGCYRSAMMYKQDLGGTKQDYHKAKEFFSKACADGDPRALEIYEELLLEPQLNNIQKK